MQTDEFGGQPGANFTVARVRRDVTSKAAIGGFYFGRETTGSGSFNRVTGVDLRLVPRPTLEIEAFAMRSETDGEAGDWAGRTSLRLDTNAHRARLGLVHIGDAFRRRSRVRPPARHRDAVRRLRARASAGQQECAACASRRLGVNVDATGDDRYDQSLTRVGSLTYGLQFRDGATLNASVNSTYERLDAPFTVGRNLRIQAGEHAFDSVSIDYRSDQSAWLSGNVSLEAGEFWTGTQRVATGGAAHPAQRARGDERQPDADQHRPAAGDVRRQPGAVSSRLVVHAARCSSMRSSSTTAKRTRGCPTSGST